MNAATLTRQVRDRALSLGFTRVGVAPAVRSTHAGFLERWLADGRHGEMAYLAREPSRRADPTEVLPGARSILCVTLDYYPWPHDAGVREGLLSNVSVYAQNDDYHDIMVPRLRELLEFVRVASGGSVDGRAYVDTGPVLEREVAAAAGLGWVGKNTMLLDRRGSWFFIGEILLDVELVPDTPVADQCGSCTACIDACPTDALLPGYILDSRRCISYLNIELRSSIPVEQRADLGEHLFGCDICQDVCPYNSRAPQAESLEFSPRRSLKELSLADLLGMNQDDYSRLFRGSPMKRSRRRGLARNAAVVLGNRGDREAVPALASALAEHEEPMVRSHAAWALGKLGGPGARQALELARTGDPDQDVQRESQAALDRNS